MQAIQQVKAAFAASHDVCAEPDHPSVAFALREQEDLSKALVMVWARERAERFGAEYRCVAIEPEIRTVLYETQSHKVVLMCRPDAIIERRSDGALLQWELKTKQSITKNWIDGWSHNLQLIGQQLAIRQFATDNGLKDRLIVGAMIEALVKGRRDRDDEGVPKQSSPLIYAYVKRGDGLLVQNQLSPTYKPKLPKLLVSDFMPLENWVLRELPDTITAPKACVIPPILPSEYEVEQAVEQWALAAIAAWESASQIHAEGDTVRRQTLLNTHFPQNTEHCFRYGPCPFLGPCFDAAAGEDPLASGVFIPRQPNHPEIIED